MNPHRNHVARFKRIGFLTACGLALSLAACGGGGSGGSTTPDASPWAALQGTYVVGCDGETSNTVTDTFSTQGTITITTDGSETNVSVRFLSYLGDAHCADAALVADATLTGKLTDKGKTKVYTDVSGKSVTARVFTFTYGGVTLAKGVVEGALPLPGITTDMAYVLDGGTLRLTVGGRTADGLGDRLSPRVGIRQ